MERRNFAQILKEAKIDIRREYDRLYGLFYLNKSYQINNCVGSLREYCAYYFYSLPFCGTCLTLDDFDDFYGFSFEKNPKDFDLNYLLLFCEYTYNVAVYINPMEWSQTNALILYGALSPQQYVLQLMKVVEAIGYMITKEDDSDSMAIIVPKVPEAIAVAEISDSKIAYNIIEYNHYALKGNLDKKQSILRALTYDIENKRSELRNISSPVESELFQLTNKFIRHNNEENQFISNMTPEEIENVYDDIYQMWLLAKLELDNVERKKRAKKLLGNMNG